MEGNESGLKGRGGGQARSGEWVWKYQTSGLKGSLTVSRWGFMESREGHVGLDRRDEGRPSLASPGLPGLGKRAPLSKGWDVVLQIEKESTSGNELELVIGKPWKDTCKEDRSLMTLYFFPFPFFSPSSLFPSLLPSLPSSSLPPSLSSK